MSVVDEDGVSKSVMDVNFQDPFWRVNMDALYLIADIQSRRVTVIPREEPEDVFAGNVAYDCYGEGWDGTVVVFNDCNGWDYFDSFDFNNGKTFEYEDMFSEVRNYSPESEDELTNIWRFPKN